MNYKKTPVKVLFPDQSKYVRANVTSIDIAKVASKVKYTERHIMHVAKGESPNVNTFNLLYKTIKERLESPSQDNQSIIEAIEVITLDKRFIYFQKKHNKWKAAKLLKNYINWLTKDPQFNGNTYTIQKESNEVLQAKNEELIMMNNNLILTLAKYGLTPLIQES